MKKILSLLIALCLVSTTPVVMANETSTEAIDVLKSLNIMTGYEDGTIKPEQSITRAEATTLIVNALNMTEELDAAPSTTIFKDVNEQASWAAQAINVGVTQGFIVGMGDGTFAPQANVTYAQMCVMLTSIAGYGEYASKGGYPAGYTSMAANIGINKGVAVGDNTALTRGQVAQMIYNTLTVPMLGVAEYSLAGNTFSQLDGKNGREFKTILSDKWNGYVATVTIEDTPISDFTLDNNEIKIDIVKADYWYDDYTGNTVLFDNVDVNTNIFQTGKAVFVLNDDDEIVMKYFNSTGKIKTEELNAIDYVLQSQYTTASIDKIRFGSKYYKLESGATIYVNGISVATVSESKVLDLYLGNAVGTITLLDDGVIAGYEKIMVDIWNVAKVAGVEYENGKTVVTMTTKNALTGYTAYDEIVINDEEVEENKTLVSVKKNGIAINLTELTKGDIIAYKTDITTTSTSLINPKEIIIFVSNDTITGKITAKDTEDKTITVDGVVYKPIIWNDNLVTMSEIYTLTLDPFGRIYSAEQEGSADNYAIALGVTIDGYVKLILADGTAKSYALESGAIKDFANIIGGTTEQDLRTFLAQTTNDASKRIVKYKVRNSTGEIMSIEVITPTVDNWSSGDTYKSRTNRLGSLEILDNTMVIDARNANNDPKAGAGYTKFNNNNFIDGTNYRFVAIKTGTYTNLVVLATIGTKISDTSRFAVVTKKPQADVTEDGDEVEAVEVLYKGEKTTLNFNTGVYANAGLDIGEAFYFDIDSYGYVNDVFVVYDTVNGFVDLTTAITNAGKTASDYVATTGEDAWNYTLSNTGVNANADIQFVAGYVVPGKDNVITLAEVVNPLIEIDTNIDHKTTGDKGVAIFAVTDDTEMYLYDTNSDTIKEGDKISIKADASVLASNALAKFEDKGVYKNTNNEITNVIDMTADANFAIALIIDEVVVSIYVIK